MSVRGCMIESVCSTPSVSNTQSETVAKCQGNANLRDGPIPQTEIHAYSSTLAETLATASSGFFYEHEDMSASASSNTDAVVSSLPTKTTLPCPEIGIQTVLKPFHSASEAPAVICQGSEFQVAQLRRLGRPGTDMSVRPRSQPCPEKSADLTLSSTHHSPNWWWWKPQRQWSHRLQRHNHHHSEQLIKHEQEPSQQSFSSDSLLAAVATCEKSSQAPSQLPLRVRLAQRFSRLPSLSCGSHAFPTRSGPMTHQVNIPFPVTTPSVQALPPEAKNSEATGLFSGAQVYKSDLGAYPLMASSNKVASNSSIPPKFMRGLFPFTVERSFTSRTSLKQVLASHRPSKQGARTKHNDQVKMGPERPYTWVSTILPVFGNIHDSAQC
ncbi:unnamed protein product [Protopolystoma xenopodis]|uniref:Uncharacterized protein n=1 Tax=Protopolystoma xenopodis TaxID=117903 RepID=A0A448WB84_9PLAT|nr:unnamed protein product [Protopolystoma xenopodis]